MITFITTWVVCGVIVNILMLRRQYESSIKKYKILYPTYSSTPNRHEFFKFQKTQLGFVLCSSVLAALSGPVTIASWAALECTCWKD